MQLRKPNNKEMDVLRQIAKDHGVKGCRQMRNCAIIGKQTFAVESQVATKLVAAVEAAGFFVEDMCKDSIKLNLADTFLVHRIV